ncbi:hypothetical protein CKAN_02237000 [Cinnamomum micranthum f. kanehirae]|uniref:Uncharacterized protein n=1 Tax=Cinnamomum micranthum f. kanehirae TaxID=337451 RepID=A0A3S3NRV4_9MAGN|nr:hypothetical protein CKAN_02237000 [Cinnamomum micranthum f. kanehirae]
MPIDGILVNDRTFSDPLTMVKVCEELLGVVPDVNYDCYGVQSKFTWLRENFGEMPKSRPRDEDVRRTCAFQFCFVAGSPRPLSLPRYDSYQISFLKKTGGNFKRKPFKKLKELEEQERCATLA